MKRQNKKAAPLPLTETEQSSLLFMAEEEKLALDVYSALGEMWDIAIFDNIARAESNHLNSVAQLASKYNLSSNLLPEGEFANPELQALYDNLVNIGSQSLTDALKVGIAIELVDIEDLTVSLATTTNSSMITTYNKLLSGSENHLDGFKNTLAKYDDSFVSEDALNWLTNEITELSLVGQNTISIDSI